MIFDEFMAGIDLLTQSVDEPGFAWLFARKSYRCLGPDGMQVQFIDLAAMSTLVQGRGIFTRFVQRLRRTYPAYGLYVENVTTERFSAGLRRMGFEEDVQGDSHSFYLLPTLTNSKPNHPTEASV